MVGEKYRADYEVGGLDTEISVDGAKAKDGIEQIIKGLKKLEKEYKAVGNVDMAKQIKAFQQEFYKATKGGENLNKLIKQMQTLLKSNGKDTFAKQFEETLKNVNRELDKTKKKVKEVQVDPKKSFNKDLINYERQLKSSGKYNAAKRVSDYRAGLKYGEVDLDKLSKQAEQIYGNGAGAKLKDVVNGAMSSTISPELEARLAEMEKQEAEAQKKKTQELQEQKEIIKQTEELKKSLMSSGDEEGAKQLAETIKAMKSSVGNDTLKIVPDDVVTNANKLVDTIQKSSVLQEEDKNRMIENVRLSAEKAANAEAERIAQEQYNAGLNEEARIVEELADTEENSNGKAEEKKNIFHDIIQIVKEIKEGYKGTIVEIESAKDKTKELKEETGDTKTKWNEVGESIKKAVDFLKGFGMVALIRKGVMGIARAWKTLINYADKVGEISGGLLQTQHMFNTIMGESVEEATEFQKKMNETFGTNMADTMKYQSYFMQMATSMGIANKEAYTLSKGLTMLGEDLAGFYGISEDSAMQKLRLGLSGQTKSLRSLGLDVTNQTMAPIAQELGITKSVKNMSQGEKVALRYITIMKQTQQMQGELAKKNFQLGDSEETLAARIETPANQLRVLKQQVKELGISIGNIFLPILQKILPYVNGFVMALKEIANMIAVLLGFNSSLKDGFGTSGVDLSEDLGLDDAVGKAKELNKQLNIDELNVLKEDTSGTSGGFGIDPALLSALEAYDNGMENIKMKAIEIRDTILEWLGFSKEFNEETGEWEWNFNSEENLENARRLLNILKTIGIVIAGLTLIKLALSAIATYKTLVANWKALKAILGVVLLVISTFMYFNTARDIVNKGTMSLKDMGNMLKWIGGIILSVIILGFGAIPAAIAGVIAAVGMLAITIYTYRDEIVTNIKVGLNWLGAKTMEILATIGKVALDVWTNISYGFKKAWYVVLDWLKGAFETAVIALAKPFESFINDIIRSLNAIITFFGGKGFDELKITETLEKKYSDKQQQRSAEIEGIEAERIAKLNELNQGLDDVIKKFERQKQENEWKIYGDYLDSKTPEQLEKLEQSRKETQEVIDSIKSFFTGSNAPEATKASEQIAENTQNTTDILGGIKDNVANLKENLGVDIELPENITLDGIDNLDEGIDLGNDLLSDNVGVDKDIKGLIGDSNNMLDTKVTSTDLSHATDTLNTSIAGVKRACENIRINVTNNYSSGGGGSSSSSSSSSKSSSSGSSSKSTLLSAVSSVVKTVGKVLGFADGGMPPNASLFYANENGAPELIGQIGNRAAVANSQQIVEAVSTGVANAVARTLGSQSDRPINLSVQVDSREIARANNQGQRKIGYGIVGGAFAKG